MERRLQQIADILQKEAGIMAVPCSGLEGLPGLVFTMPWNETYRASAGLTLVLERVVECETPVLIQGGIATPEDLIDRLTPPPPPPQPERLYQCEIRWRFNRKNRREGIAIAASLVYRSTRLRTTQVRSVAKRPIAEIDLLIDAVDSKSAVQQAQRLLKESPFLRSFQPLTIFDEV